MDVVAEAGGLGGGVADSVPRARRRQPRADGLEHAAPGGADLALGSAAGRYRHGARIVARDSGVCVVARRGGVIDSVDATRIVVKVNDDESPSRAKPGVDIYNLTKFHAFQPEHLHQPAPAGQAWAIVIEAGRHPRGRSLHRPRRTGAGPEHARRLHALERLQLRGLDPDLRAPGAGRPLHLDSHRGASCIAAAIPSSARKRSPATSRTSASRRCEARRVGHRLHRRLSQSRRHPGRQGHAEGRNPADAGREAAARHLRREGLGREGHLAARAPGVNGTVIDVQVFTRDGVEKDAARASIEKAQLDKVRGSSTTKFRIVEDGLPRAPGPPPR